MISKTPTKETPFQVQHGYASRYVDEPNDDVNMCEADEPSEFYVDGYCSTIEEARELARSIYMDNCEEDRYRLWFDIEEQADWNGETKEYETHNRVEAIDFWMDSLLQTQMENKEAIAKIMMKVIDLENPARTSIVLLKALRECMTNSVVGMMTNRDEIISYVYDKDNWEGDVYEPELAMRLLDAARKKAMGALSKDYFEEDE